MENSCIILDCKHPIKPDQILIKVLSKTALNIEDFKLESKFFGQWTFRLNDDKEQLYQENLNIIISEIKKAYSSGQLRYAEW